MLAVLSEEDQRLVQSLMEVGFSETAKMQGINRNVLLRRIRVVRSQIQEHITV